MRTAWATYPVNFEGGLITNLSILEQGLQFPGSARIIENFEASIEGGYSKILGYQKYNSNAVPGTGLISGVVLVDSDKVITCRDGIYYYATSTSQWEEKLDLSATPGGRIYYDTFNFNGNKKIVIVDGVNFPVFWDESTNTIVEDTAAPADVRGVTNVIVFKDHVFFAKDQLLYFTAPLGETNYDAADGSGVINVGTSITGVVIFRDELIIFGSDSIKRLSGNTSLDFQLQPITNKTGCLSGDTIQEVGGDILYLGPDGLRFLSATDRIGDFALERASENIQSEMLRKINGGGTITSVVIRGKNQYRLFEYLPSLPKEKSDGFICTRFIDRSANGVSWSTTKGIKVYSADSRQFQDRERVVFSTDTGYIYDMESGNSFDGEDIMCRYSGPYLPITDPRIRKTLYKASIYIRSLGFFDAEARFTFDYDAPKIIQPKPIKLSGDNSTFLFGSSTFGDARFSQVTPDIITKNVVGSGFVVSLEIFESSKLPSFRITSMTVEYAQNDRK